MSMMMLDLFKRPGAWFVAACLAAWAMPAAAVGEAVWRAPLRIDLGMATGRNDTAADGWQEWQVPNGPAAERAFGDVKVTLRAGDGGTLEGAWYKAGLATGAIMATDGVVAKAGGRVTAIEITLAGLSAGAHSLATYHNWLTHEQSGGVKVSVVEQAGGGAVNPTVQIANDVDAASVYVEFTAAAGKPVVLRIEGTSAGGASSSGDVVVNGLEIDGVNPKAKAMRPVPTNEDWHVAGEEGRVALGWQKAANAVRHELYTASDVDGAKAFDAVASADRNSSDVFRGTVKEGHAELAVSPQDSSLTLCWRIDSIDAAGKATRGDVWSFRVRHLAFPGAEGYGRFALGGRGGRVIKVTTLADAGPGSLRAAVEAEGPRIVVFDVSGRIVLQSRLIIRQPSLTIAGQTAPGKGICLSNYNLGMLGSHDVMIRHLRVRPGDTAGQTLDGMGMASSDHAIFDHCSISWTQDESFSSRGAKNITLQRTLISEALNIAGHKKYAAGKQHGYAASISGDIGSFHHNLLAHCSGRNWSLAGGLDKAQRHAGRLDLRNNVVYNWGHRTTDGGAKEVNFVNNYYKPGPASHVFHVLMSEREMVSAFGPQDYFVAGNVMLGKFDAATQHDGVIAKPQADIGEFLKDKPFFESFVTTETAEQAYASVLADVGCNRPALDEHDRRVIEEVRQGTTTYQGSQSGLPGLPDSQKDVGGWEDYPEVHREASFDGDGDGIADAWELQHKLDPHSAADSSQDADGDGFTNIEEYLNDLAERK